MSRDFDVIVIGAGAAGMMCAAIAGQRGRRVLLLDHAEKPGKKILISGGGRCNFTNLHCAPENFLSQNRHFHKSALAQYTQYDFIDMVDRHGIPWHEKTLGQLFCDGSAREIVAMLLAECAVDAVEIRLGCTVSDTGLPRMPGISPAMRWCWPPAACRSRKWARPDSPIASQSSSGWD
jgi:predicted Rossmann fold flavoprotein